MEGKQISVEQLKRALAEDFDQLTEEIVKAMNAAQPGRIIADSEELVRDASAEFRERMFQKAIGLLQEKQEAFPPSGQNAQEQGQAGDNTSDGKRADPGA
jgi:DNA primase large subunit